MGKLIFAVLTVIMMNSCASMQELSQDVMQQRKSGTAGVTRVYPIPADQAWEISRAVFRWEKVDGVEEHREENYMITSTGMNMVAFGSVMGVWIEPADSIGTKVTVLTKRRVAKDTFTKLNDATFFERFEQGLKIVQDGKKLPVVPPEKK
ncbi:MAG: hypothetical protein EG824_03605 [Deltaproteobacteria bacterium]|nr:hypothetical protein [Deltaproteobacteria bacterium]